MKSNCFFQVIPLALSLIFTSSALAKSIPSKEALAWANSNAKELLETFKEKDEIVRFAKLDTLIKENVDLDYIAKFVVGKYWRNMTSEQKAQYVPLFKRYAVASYKRFPLDFAQNIDYKFGQAVMGKNFTTVSSAVSVDLGGQNGRQDFLLSFKLHDTQGKIKLVDIKLAESSLILSYRGKFYQQIAELEGEIEWFLEDLEMMTKSLERQTYS